MRWIGSHCTNARHTLASILIAADANPKAIQDYMDHSTIQMTFDKYGHLMPGNRDAMRTLTDRYLEEAVSV